MKYINLLPPEFQVKSADIERKTKPSSKAMLGCLIVPGLMAAAALLAIAVIQYRYRHETTGREIQTESATTADDETLTVTTRPFKRRQVASPKQARPPAEAGGQNVPTTTESQPKPAVATEKKADVYTLYLGAFVSQAEASALVDGLLGQNLTPYWKSKQVSGTVYTIYVGQASSMEEAVALTRQLEAQGYEAVIKLNSKGVNLVGVKGYPTKSEAEELAKQLSSLGYPAKLVPERDLITVYQLNLGSYKEYREAKNVQNQLEELGYNIAAIVRK